MEISVQIGNSNCNVRVWQQYVMVAHPGNNRHREKTDQEEVPSELIGPNSMID
jgi:hypothetical protein